MILKMKRVIKNHPKHLNSKKDVLATPVGGLEKPEGIPEFWEGLRNKEFGPMGKMDRNG